MKKFDLGWLQILVLLLTAIIAVSGVKISYDTLRYMRDSEFAKIEISPSRFVINQYPFEILKEGEEREIELTLFNSGGSNSGYVSVSSYDSDVFYQSFTESGENIPPKQSVRLTIPFGMIGKNEEVGELKLPIRVRCENCKDKEELQYVSVCIYRQEHFQEDCPRQF